MSNVTSIEDAPKSKQERLDDYCEGICNGLTREAAYIAAGYSSHNCRSNAHKYYRQNADYIQAYIAEHIGSHVPTALKVIVSIVNDPNEKGGIRLKAAQDILDRGGFGAKQKIELTTKDTKDMTTEELQNEIIRLASENPLLSRLIDPSISVSK
jgi:hypothetical protein